MPAIFFRRTCLLSSFFLYGHSSLSSCIVYSCIFWSLLNNWLYTRLLSMFFIHYWYNMLFCDRQRTVSLIPKAGFEFWKNRVCWNTPTKYWIIDERCPKFIQTFNDQVSSSSSLLKQMRMRLQRTHPHHSATIHAVIQLHGTAHMSKILWTN